MATAPSPQRIIPPLIRLGLSGAGLLLLAILWLWFRNPAPLPPSENLRLVRDQSLTRTKRTLHDLVFSSRSLGQIHAILSLPAPLPLHRTLPLIVVLGGLSAWENLAYLPDVGQNAVLMYDWPFETYLPANGFEFMAKTPHYYRQLDEMPAQIAAVTRWAQQRPYIDMHRTSLLGFSLGAMAAPAAQDLLEHGSEKVRWTVLAEGGCPLGDVLLDHPTFRQRPGKPILRWALNLLTRPVDPCRHLSSLHGRFLMLYSSDDPMVPLEASRRMLRLTPAPKEIIALQGGHMGIWRKQELAQLRQIGQITLRWLVRQGAIAPLGQAIRNP